MTTQTFAISAAQRDPSFENVINALQVNSDYLLGRENICLEIMHYNATKTNDYGQPVSFEETHFYCLFTGRNPLGEKDLENSILKLGWKTPAIDFNWKSKPIEYLNSFGFQDLKDYSNDCMQDDSKICKFYISSNDWLGEWIRRNGFDNIDDLNDVIQKMLSCPRTINVTAPEKNIQRKECEVNLEDVFKTEKNEETIKKEEINPEDALETEKIWESPKFWILLSAAGATGVGLTILGSQWDKQNDIFENIPNLSELLNQGRETIQAAGGKVSDVAGKIHNYAKGIIFKTQV